MCFAKKFELESRVFPFKTSSLEATKQGMVSKARNGIIRSDAYPMIRQPAVLASANVKISVLHAREWRKTHRIYLPSPRGAACFWTSEISSLTGVGCELESGAATVGRDVDDILVIDPPSPRKSVGRGAVKGVDTGNERRAVVDLRAILRLAVVSMSCTVR